MADPVVVTVADPGLAAAFSRHPEIRLEAGEPTRGEASWKQGTWARSIARGSDAEVRGLVEVIDNNPMVCCDDFATPGPMATVALLALAPAARASMLGSPVRLAFSHDPEPSLSGFLDEAGISQWHGEASGGGKVCRASARFTPSQGSSRSDLEAAYAEYYDRAFFVRTGQADPTGSASGYVWLKFDGDDVLASAAADAQGKAGAAQVVHAFNVMCGFVESLGVTDPRDL